MFARTAAPLNGEEDAFPPTDETIRTLLALGLYEPAVKELEFAQAKWGDSPAIPATIAWANKQMAASESGTRQFALARGSITLMKRAYPQFMASGGEELPREILTTIFPLELLGSDQEIFGAARSGSVSRGGADGAGIDVRPRHPIACQRVRPDAADAVDRRGSTRAS